MPRRKAEVVAAVRGGLISLEQAGRRYSLAVEEFLAWRDSVDRYGLPGFEHAHSAIGRAVLSPTHDLTTFS